MFIKKLKALWRQLFPKELDTPFLRPVIPNRVDWTKKRKHSAGNAANRFRCARNKRQRNRRRNKLAFLARRKNRWLAKLRS